MFTIDGAHGEGGGQIIRSALALSLATGAPFRIEHIRAGRAKPGLLRQHLTCVAAAQAISRAEVEGAQLGSRALTFRPGALTPGEYHFDIGSAGSTLLVAQAVVPAMLRGGGAWRLTLGGGTHNPSAPSFDFFARALAPMLARLGAPITATLDRAGFYPRGGGRVAIEVAGGGRLGHLELVERGAALGRRVEAIVANLPATIGAREVAAATARLGWEASTGAIVEVASPGPGNTVAITVEHAKVTEVFTAHGARGVAAETVARAAADECAAYLAARAPVGAYLADQLLVPLALGDGGRFTTTVVSDHTHTQIALLRQLLGVEVIVDDRGAEGFELTVPAAR